MPICQNCGAELEGKFCSSCGTPAPEASTAQASQPAPVQPTPPPVTPPMQQPMPQPQPQRFNPPPAPVYNNVSIIQQTKVTSAGGWIGWIFLLTLLPLIGHIIMLCCSNDPSAKNFVRAQLALALLGLVAFLLLLVFASVGANM